MLGFAPSGEARNLLEDRVEDCVVAERVEFTVVRLDDEEQAERVVVTGKRIELQPRGAIRVADERQRAQR